MSLGLFLLNWGLRLAVVEPMAGFPWEALVACKSSEVRPKLTGNGILWGVHSFWFASRPQPRVVLAFKALVG